jgi:hypothetical protein
MTYSELATGIALIVLVWFWFDSTAARERALRAATSACREAGVQLLDDTIAIRRLRLGLNSRKDPVLRRVYDFEYSQTGNDRMRGTVILEGAVVTLVDVGVLHVA